MNPRTVIIVSLGILSPVLLALVWNAKMNTRADQIHSQQPTSQEIVVTPISEPLNPVQEKEEIEVYTVKKGDYLGRILPQYGLPTAEILSSSEEIFDLSRIRVGKTFSFIKREGAYVALRYPIDQDNTLYVQKVDNTWIAKKETVQYTKKETLKNFSIEESFWKSAANAGLQARDISSLVQLFEYDIDFNTEIRKKGHVRMIIEELSKEGTFIRYAPPLIVEFTNDKEHFTAIRYKNEHGTTMYYDEKGISRKGAFLRSPLAYSRVTSGFNPKRFHPVLKVQRPHNGTDFGAPKGTPVRAVASGRITYAGSNGGHGKFVKIKHTQGYETSYSHLSKILVRKGTKVEQGKVIGRVGSTGLSTGDHLHYQMWKNGRFVDAMKVKLPKDQKISSSEKQDFEKHRVLLKKKLDTFDAQ